MDYLMPDDAQFLGKLSSLCQAITFTATDPITIMHHYEGSNGASTVGMFYDAFGDGGEEDIALGEVIIKKRIRTAPFDIKDHYRYHENVLRRWNSLQESLRARKTEIFRENTIELCNLVEEYIENIVVPHKRKNEKESFLEYPNCYRQFAFHIPKTNHIGSLRFNVETSYEGAKEDLAQIIDYLPQMDVDTLPKITTLDMQHDSGQGYLNCSLRGRLALNKELLSRINFRV